MVCLNIGDGFHSGPGHLGGPLEIIHLTKNRLVSTLFYNCQDFGVLSGHWGMFELFSMINVFFTK